MTLEKSIEQFIKNKRTETFNKTDQLTLGELIAKCEAIAERGYRLSDGSKPTVSFDFEYMGPTDISSWRGSYDELALGFGDGCDPALTDFIDMLKGVVGKQLEGYKGGEYTMTEQTPVWVANYGNSGNTAVVDVLDKEWQVIIATGYCEF